MTGTGYVQTFGKKKTAVAIAYIRKGHEGITINDVPINLVEPAPLRVKLLEPIILLGEDMFKDFTFRIRCRGGGHVSQLYAARQAIAKGIVAYHQKFTDEASKKNIKDKLLNYDRSLLVTDQRRKEPKKFGGPGARAKYQKSYR